MYQSLKPLFLTMKQSKLHEKKLFSIFTNAIQTCLDQFENQPIHSFQVVQKNGRINLACQISRNILRRVQKREKTMCLFLKNDTIDEENIIRFRSLLCFCLQLYFPIVASFLKEDKRKDRCSNRYFYLVVTQIFHRVI